MLDKLKKISFLSREEIIAISIIILVLGVVVSLLESLETFFYSILAVSLVVLINISAKKVAAFYLDSKIEIGIWEIKKYWIKPGYYFKKPMPIGAILPLVAVFLSLGHFIWMASLIFDAKPKVYRAAKRHGYYSFSEMTEQHLGFMASAGVFANLLFAVIGYLTGFPDFTKLNIYLAFFSLIPLSDLDGNKIFFGSLPLWSFLIAITLVGLFYAIFMI